VQSCSDSHTLQHFLFSWLQKCLSKLAKAFPNAIPNAELVERVSQRLRRYGYDSTTLVAFSLCSDEVNRPLEDAFYGYYGEHFNMGGLAGFPFAGVTGFGAMASHIPDGGSCLLVYGPHVGIDSSGYVGKIDRKGKSTSGGCCGSAVAASRYITAVHRGDVERITSTPTDPVDAQQSFVAQALLPYGERIATAADPMIELPICAFEPIDSMMSKIVKRAGPGVGGNGRIALLGGLQINTPRGISDYFQVERFEIREKTGELVEDLNWKPRKLATESIALLP
jgi:Limiting CO2-inducible proteins B/C beta carbonyic anhydrases